MENRQWIPWHFFFTSLARTQTQRHARVNALSIWRAGDAVSAGCRKRDEKDEDEDKRGDFTTFIVDRFSWRFNLFYYISDLTFTWFMTFSKCIPDLTQPRFHQTVMKRVGCKRGNNKIGEAESLQLFHTWKSSKPRFLYIH